jgi:hypothetical protein
MARFDDRRDSARLAAVENRAMLAWHEREDARWVEVTVRDVSQSGASVWAAELPELPATVWVRIQQPRPTEWAAADVIGIARVGWRPWSRGRRFSIRLRFVDGCPYDFMRVAIHGRGLDEKGVEHFPGDTHARDWR